MRRAASHAAWLFSLLPLTGCKTGGEPPTKEAVVYNSFRTAWDVAFEAYKQAHKLDLQGKLPEGRIVQVNRKWVQFRNTHKLAFQAASKDWSTVAPADVLLLRDELLNLIKNL